VLCKPVARPRDARPAGACGSRGAGALLDGCALIPLTIVVLTYNRAKELLATLERLVALPEQAPVVVVDNASRDGTSERVSLKFPQVKLIRLERNLGAAGRNAGAAFARTPYVAFSDDDAWWAPGSLARAVEILERHPRVAALTGQVLVGREEKIDAASREMAASPLAAVGLPGPRLLGFLAGASVFRRGAFLAAGGYDARLFLGAEEKLLAYDLAARGWSIAYSPALVAHHHPSALRDGRLRSAVLARNELWIAWLRRPLSAALRQTLRTPPRALWRALPGIGWVLRERRVLPRDIEILCELVDRSRNSSCALSP
jgi:GT2 family glycosyltransferase